MVFDPTIPQPTDKPAASQPKILSNFSLLNSLFGLNHYAFNDPTVANRAKHKYTTLVNQAAGGPVTIAGELALYSKSVGGAAVLFVKRDGGASEVQLTTRWNPVNAANGLTYLAGNLIMQWGITNAPSGESGNIAYPLAFAAAPHCIQISVLRQVGSSTTPVFISSTNPPTATVFRIVNTSSNAHNVYWLAIGTPS